MPQEVCVKLSNSEYQDEVEKIYKRLSPADRIKICALNCNAVPGMYPVLGAKPHKMFKGYCNKKNAKKIRDYCDSNNQIVLPKHILLTNNNGITTYLGPRYTKFSERNLARYNLKQVELENSFVITKSTGVNTSCSTLNAPSSIYSNLNVESSSESSEDDVNRDDIQISDCRFNQSVEDRPEIPDDITSEHSNLERSGQPEETPHDNDQEDDSDSQSSESSTNTEPVYSMNYRNVFRIPEKLSNDKIMSLIHCSKKQFLDFANLLRPHLKVNEDFLSLYARVFLFRFKVSYI